MSNPRPGPDRCPLNEAELRHALIQADGSDATALWRKLTVVTETSSTNGDLAAAARDNADEGTVLIAESQTSGRGRHDRAWISPPRAGLTFSVLLRPRVPMRHWGWLPLLTGVAVTQAIADECGLAAALKWPNDVLLATPARKVAGILAAVVPTPAPALVVGIGINVSTQADDLPSPDATSLFTEGGSPVDRFAILVAVLRRLATQYECWQDHEGDVDFTEQREVYRRRCHTLGKRVTLRMSDKPDLVGQALDVDDMGQLAIATDTGLVSVAAGDVIHVR